MSGPVTPLRSRLVPLLVVFFGAPVSAEYLQAYLAGTGDAAVMAGGLLVLGPLYGGAALLIREVAVRTGRGWRGVLVLGAAWGVLLPGVIDLAMFGAHRDDVDYWDALREPTLIHALGISGFNSVTWVAGHVLLSVFAPLGLLHALAPGQRGRPMLRHPGVVVVVVLLLVAAVTIHVDGRRIYDYAPSAGQALSVVAVVGLLIGLALSPFGRPGPPPPATPTTAAWRPVTLGVGAMLLTTVIPPYWAGVAALLVVFGVVAFVVRRWSRTRRWGAREIGLVAAGLVIGQTGAGFLSPTPAGVDVVAKTASQLVLLALGVALLVWVVRTTDAPAAAADVEPLPR